MSELQISLTAIGGIFITAVFLFNRWQERKYHKQTEKLFRGERQDVLFDEQDRKPGAERVEPSFDSAQVTEQVVEEPLSITPEPAVEEPIAPAPVRREPVAPAAAIETPREEVTSRRLIDESIDLIGIIHLAQPATDEVIRGLIARAENFSKPVHWEAKGARGWTEVSSNGQYTQLRVALQLADRRGPATSAEISSFLALINRFAVELDGAAQTEAEESAAARATELDGFCAGVDVEIGVNVLARGHTMHATKLRALAESSGLKLHADGIFHYCDDYGGSIFTLRNAEPRPFVPEQVKNISTGGVTLLLDVPRVAHNTHAFDQMLQLARHIAEVLGGDVVDDHSKPLTDTGVNSIRRQLNVIYKEMDGSGIPAGSPLALRLFS